MSDGLKNFFWIMTGGILISAVYFLASLIFMLTIVYFRTGLALLKLARYSLTPFGQSWKNLAVTDITFEENSGLLYYLRVILWFPFMVVITAAHLFLTMILCMTVSGITLARTHYMLIRFAAFPMIDTAKTRDACLFCD